MREGNEEKINNDSKSPIIDLTEDDNALEQYQKLVPVPVRAGARGVGLPYAPENWPNPGDMWTWRVGTRLSKSGHYCDRYLYPPERYRKIFHGKKPGFQSKSSIEDFFRKEFKNVDLNVFFGSFLWRIPARGLSRKTGIEKTNSSIQIKTQNGEPEPTGPCRARNSACNLNRQKPNTESEIEPETETESESESFPLMSCDACCAEPSFCRKCCCILCCRPVDSVNFVYNFIKCESKMEDESVCGHGAHIECALRCYLGGTVGGRIALDAEYYCRRCDSKTDLIPHLTKFFRVCESSRSKEEIEKVLNLGLCALRGSKQMVAKNLLNRMLSAMEKIKQGVPLGEIWKVDSATFHTTGEYYPKSEIIMLGAQQTLDCCKSKPEQNDCKIITSDQPVKKQKTDNGSGPHLPAVYITSDHRNLSVKLEDEIDCVLRELKKSQELEYRLAEQKLYAQKDRLLSLYRLLDTERAELADCTELLSSVVSRVDQIKSEEEKFRGMLKIANGFGQIDKSVLKEQFGIEIDD